MSQFKFSWPPANDWEALKSAVLKQIVSSFQLFLQEKFFNLSCNHSQEFYLSPENLRRDFSMMSSVLQHGGCVKLSKIMRFQRMRSLPLTEDQVAKIIRENSTALKMSFSNLSVRRHPELR